VRLVQVYYVITITGLLAPYKDQCHTIIFDNGKEFAEYEKVAEALKADTFPKAWN